MPSNLQKRKRKTERHCKGRRVSTKTQKRGTSRVRRRNRTTRTKRTKQSQGRSSPSYGIRLFKNSTKAETPERPETEEAKQIETDKWIAIGKPFSELKEYMKGWIKNNKDAWDGATISVYDERSNQSIQKPDVFKRLYFLDTGEYDNAKTESRKKELREAAKKRQLSPDIIYTMIVNSKEASEQKEKEKKEQEFSPRQLLAIQDVRNTVNVFCPETCDKNDIEGLIDTWQDTVRFPQKVTWKDFLPFCITLSQSEIQTNIEKQKKKKKLQKKKQ